MFQADIVYVAVINHGGVIWLRRIALNDINDLFSQAAKQPLSLDIMQLYGVVRWSVQSRHWIWRGCVILVPCSCWPAHPQPVRFHHSVWWMANRKALLTSLHDEKQCDGSSQCI